MAYCECGCGNRTAGGRFQPGHDARLLGNLLSMVRGGNSSQRNSAINMISELGWSRKLYGERNRTYGVELEVISPENAYIIADALIAEGVLTTVEGYNHNTRDTWKIVTDSSIRTTNENPHGLEVVSPVLHGVDGRKQIRKVCKVLNNLGVTVNRSCGLHVHHAAHDLTLNDFKRLAVNYNNNQQEIDRMMPSSRRGNRNIYCMDFDPADLSAINYASNLMELAGRISRYRKLNLTSYASYGTVEFRHHSGTINAEKILRWVEFGQQLIQFSRKNEGPHLLRDILRPTTRNYYANRAAQLAA